MRSGFFGGLGLVILVVLAVIAWSSLFVVSQTQQALVLRFGNPINVITEPGLYVKAPLIDNVVMIDKRVLDIDAPPIEVIARDQKRLVVDAFGRYRITDPLLFFQAAGSIEAAESRLSVILNSAIRGAVGQMEFANIVREGRAGLMESITRQVNAEGRQLGVDVIDVRIRRADLPAENSQAVFQRMQTERQREATDIRSRGEQEARTIRAQADRQATVIVAEANRQADELRGEGEAQANGIFATAFNRDPDFFAFFRSMEAYREGLKGENTRIVISPDMPFFRYLTQSPVASGLGGAVVPAPAAAPAASVAPPPPAPAAPAAAPQPAQP
ncbi:protease modulator HflC [Kaistia geumhonensis]|uniref:Protein HflC n=1 Tax=Kaistia geumhonensis TaxID=410839 RepID=A0ABU0MC17_9HYPH|nr:protease modulator HflC [Kaistia geumhonensis]MCX5481441.1 protease modulator HflC [Kaistia geumhonensis]MDQ0518506.1 membrane protease subunit HflC [Kaistia geumhonensis]